jgi:glutamate synthase (NADPH/NADH) large chain
MTGGTAVILGPVGDNFAAGMTGGMAFIYDWDGEFERRLNMDTVVCQRIETYYWEVHCRDLIAEHARETQSSWVQRLIANWDFELAKFWQVIPKEMVGRLEHPATISESGAERRA